MERFVVSPELALVDPELRARALEVLQAYPPVPPVPARIEPIVVPRAPAAARPRAARPRLALAAAVYLATTAARILFLDALFVLVIAALVLAINLLA
jgi:hypothetical protein